MLCVCSVCFFFFLFKKIIEFIKQAIFTVYTKLIKLFLKVNQFYNDLLLKFQLTIKSVSLLDMISSGWCRLRPLLLLAFKQFYRIYDYSAVYLNRLFFVFRKLYNMAYTSLLHSFLSTITTLKKKLKKLRTACIRCYYNFWPVTKAFCRKIPYIPKFLIRQFIYFFSILTGLIRAFIAPVKAVYTGSRVQKHISRFYNSTKHWIVNWPNGGTNLPRNSICLRYSIRVIIKSVRSRTFPTFGDFLTVFFTVLQLVNIIAWICVIGIIWYKV